MAKGSGNVLGGSCVPGHVEVNPRPRRGSTHEGTAVMSRLGTAVLTVVTTTGLLLAGCTSHTDTESPTDNRAATQGGSGAQGSAKESGGGLAYDGGARKPDALGSAPERRAAADGVPGAPQDLSGPASADNLSTFALDVDTASYDYAARVLTDGSLPDPAQIRPEEFINAFDQDYPYPPDDGIAIHTDGFRLPAWHEGERPTRSNDIRPAFPQGDTRLLRIGLQTRPERFGHRADANLTFVIDVSGSMREPGRLDLVQEALHTLIDELRPTDAVAIVAYSTTARVIQPMTPVSEKADLHRAVDALAPEDSTNLEAGLVTGYRVAREGFREGVTNRVILLSDGLANVGNTTPEAILTQVRESAGKDIALLCVGVGRQYGDHLMEQLADNGEGFAVYVSSLEQARRIFVERLPGTLAVRARDAKVQVVFDPETVVSHRLIGFDNRAVADEDFRNDAVDGGELGPGHSVTALYAVTLRPRVGAAGSYRPVATVTARWLDPETGRPSEATARVHDYELDVPYASAAPRLRLDYVVGTFALCLRGGGYRVAYGDGKFGDGDVESMHGGGLGCGPRVVYDDGVEGPGQSVPEPVSLARLAAEADELAAVTEDRRVAQLAELIRRADLLMT